MVWSNFWSSQIIALADVTATLHFSDNVKGTRFQPQMEKVVFMEGIWKEAGRAVAVD